MPSSPKWRPQEFQLADQDGIKNIPASGIVNGVFGIHETSRYATDDETAPMSEQLARIKCSVVTHLQTGGKIFECRAARLARQVANHLTAAYPVFAALPADKSERRKIVDALGADLILDELASDPRTTIALWRASEQEQQKNG